MIELVCIDKVSTDWNIDTVFYMSRWINIDTVLYWLFGQVWLFWFKNGYLDVGLGLFLCHGEMFSVNWTSFQRERLPVSGHAQ